MSNIVASSYLSEDLNLLAAEAAYCAKGGGTAGVSGRTTTRQTHDYDEYHFDLDEIEHDPYVLMSILSALHEGSFTIDQVQGDLQMLVRQAIHPDRNGDQVDRRIGREHGTWTARRATRMKLEGPYDYYICTVKLENFDLYHLPVYMMDEETLSMYAVYMSTLGNRPDLFPLLRVCGTSTSPTRPPTMRSQRSTCPMRPLPR